MHGWDNQICKPHLVSFINNDFNSIEIDKLFYINKKFGYVFRVSPDSFKLDA